MEDIRKSLEKFVQSQLESAEKFAHTGSEVYALRGVAYGAVQFCMEAGLLQYGEVNRWWEDQWLLFEKMKKNMEETNNEK